MAKVGGFESMRTKFSYAISHTTLFSNSTCGLPKDDYFNMVRNFNSEFPWTGKSKKIIYFINSFLNGNYSGMSLGMLITSVWYWCSE